MFVWWNAMRCKNSNKFCGLGWAADLHVHVNCHLKKVIIFYLAPGRCEHFRHVLMKSTRGHQRSTLYDDFTARFFLRVKFEYFANSIEKWATKINPVITEFKISLENVNCEYFRFHFKICHIENDQFWTSQYLKQQNSYKISKLMSFCSLLILLSVSR